MRKFFAMLTMLCLLSGMGLATSSLFLTSTIIESDGQQEQNGVTFGKVIAKSGGVVTGAAVSTANGKVFPDCGSPNNPQPLVQWLDVNNSQVWYAIPTGGVYTNRTTYTGTVGNTINAGDILKATWLGSSSCPSGVQFAVNFTLEYQ